MKILYQEDGLLIADTGVTANGEHIPLRRIISWEKDTSSHCITFYLRLTTFDPFSFFFGKPKVRITYVNCVDYLPNETIDGIFPVIDQSDDAKVRRERRYTEIPKALDLMLAHK